jgi:hypothetical protein
LSWRIGLDPATAREKVRVARALGNLPAIDAALKSGKLSYAKVRALTRVATTETEAKLLDAALYSTGAQLERLCRGYRTAMSQMTADNALPPPERSVRRRDLSGGMVKLEVVLSPDEAALVLAALDRAREVTHQQGKTDVSAEASAEDPKHPSRADGMVALAESYLAGNVGTGNGGERFQVMVHIDQDPLAPDGVLSGTLDDGTRVSAEAIRRVACDCGIVAVPSAAPAAETPRPATRAEVAASASPRPATPGEVDALPSPRPATRGEVDARSAAGEGLPGRRSRSIPPSIRRAITLRDRGCAFPGCTHDRFLHGHHIQHWLHGGATSVNNLALLCTRHHHLVHEGGWSVARTADGELRFRAPDGKEVLAVPAREASEDAVVFLREWAEERGLDIGAETNVPLWDGTRPDYDWAVAALVSGAAV